MRKFVKTAAVLALAFALLSTSAFAELTTEGSGVVRNEDGTFTATIAGAQAEEQITILATDVAELASVTDANIFYINQKAATGASDSFANFNLKNVTPGNTYYFFAGSATSSTVTPLGSVEVAIPYSITLSDDVAIEVGQTTTIIAAVSPADYEGEIEWSVNSADATLTPDESGLGATLTSTVVGAYTVTATLDNDASATVVVTVNPKDVSVAAPTFTLVNALATEEGSTAENQNGLGVALTFADVEESFTKMIWVFADGSEGEDARRYSAPIVLDEAVKGAYTFKAAFGNGTANGSITPYNVQSVDAIFTDGIDTYYTNQELDEPNYLPASNN